MMGQRLILYGFLLMLYIEGNLSSRVHRDSLSGHVLYMYKMIWKKNGFENDPILNCFSLYLSFFYLFNEIFNHMDLNSPKLLAYKTLHDIIIFHAWNADFIKEKQVNE